MESKWYYITKDDDNKKQKNGPISWTELIELKSNDKINGKTMVSDGNIYKNWSKLKDVIQQIKETKQKNNAFKKRINEIQNVLKGLNEYDEPLLHEMEKILGLDIIPTFGDNKSSKKTHKTKDKKSASNA